MYILIKNRITDFLLPTFFVCFFVVLVSLVKFSVFFGKWQIQRKLPRTEIMTGVHYVLKIYSTSKSGQGNLEVTKKNRKKIV